MPKTIEEYKQLDNEHKGTENDFDERLKVTYYIDKHHRVKAILDIYSGVLTIGDSTILWSKQGGYSMNITQRLKEYKKLKGEVKNTQARIDNYKEFLKNENVELYTYVNTPDNIGMPKAPFSQKSSTESAVIEKELDRETVQQWIKDDESRIFWKKLEVEQIEIALDSLTSEQRFVVEKKHIEDWMWRAIEREFNERFEKQRGYITESGLRKTNDTALKTMEEILRPFYSQYNIA